MLVTGLFHCAIKTNDLKATVGFYTRVLGLREVARPDFGYPGAWLACPAPGGDAIVHIYAGGPALGREGKAPSINRARSPANASVEAGPPPDMRDGRRYVAGDSFFTPRV